MAANPVTSALPVSLALAALVGAPFAFGEPPDVPIVPGVNVVLAVSNATASDKAPAGTLQGDYEMVVTIAEVSEDGITHTALFDGVDAGGVQRRGTVRRVVSTGDLATAPVQVLGFSLDDPPRASGTTALGPSLGVTRDLARTGAAAYSFRNWMSRETISGTLRRSSRSPVRFPVLLNGKRVELDAIHATGQMAVGAAKRPIETVILDHPQYPISLRIAYGPRDGGFPFAAEFVRDVVRIDFPNPQSGIAETLGKECRVELKGIYFDFNKATLKPESDRALAEIASALTAARRRVTIEGHTDDIGTDRYNDDLSARRAAAVRDALVRTHRVDAAMLSTAGHGERRPIETNDTLAGRARNRRVELVCAQGK